MLGRNRRLIVGTESLHGAESLFEVEGLLKTEAMANLNIATGHA